MLASSAQLVEEQGAKILAVSDSRGGVFNKNGLQVGALRKHKEKTGSVVGFAGAKSINNEEVIETDCTILIPQPLESQITKKNAGKITAKIIAEAAKWPHNT